MKEKKLQPHLAALCAMFIWGGSYVWSTQVFETLKPGTTILLRLIISSLFLALLSSIFKLHEKIEKKDIKLFFLAAFFEPFLYFIGESYGLMRVSPTICSAIIATIPLFAPIGAFIILKERIGAKNIIGLIVSFLGVIIMLINKDLKFTASASGIMFLMEAVVSAVFYSIVLKKLADKYNPIQVVMTENALGILYFIPFVAITEFKYLPDMTRVNEYIVPLLMLGIFASSFSYVLYTYAVKKLGVARSNVYTNIIPIFTAGFSYFLIDEKITLFKALGIAVVIAGLILSQSIGKEKTEGDKVIKTSRQ